MAYSLLRSRLLASLLFWLVLVACLGWLATAQLRATTDAFEAVYRDRLLCQGQLRAVGDAYRLHIPEAMRQFLGAQIDARGARARIEAARAQAASNWALYRRSELVDAERRLIEQADPLLERADALAGAVAGTLSAGDGARLQPWNLRSTEAALEPMGRVIDQLFAIQETVAANELRRARDAERTTLGRLLLLIVTGSTLGGLFTWAMIAHHTTAERSAANALRRMNAFYTALSRTNHLIVRERDDAMLLKELCRICTETGQARITAVFLCDGTQATRFAVSGEAADFFAELPETWDVNAADYRLSVTAIALTTGTSRVGRVAPSDGPLASWRETARRYGIRSIAAFPLLRGGRVFGALTLYAGEPDFFDPALVQLLTEMAGDVAFALDNIDREAERQRLEQQTRLDLERFQRLFRAAPVACVITSLEDVTVLEVNDVMCERYGLPREAIIGTRYEKLGSLMNEVDGEKYRQLVARDGRVRNMEACMRLANGEQATMIVNAETITYDGRTCLMAMALDVTELRAAEAQQNARLTAEAANREKTAFLSRMSHELRTPLNAMLGFTQLMERDAVGRLLAQDIERLQHIRQAGWHLLSLVNDVMDVSRIEAGQFSVSRVTVELTDLLNEAVRLTEPAADAHEVAIEAAYLASAPVAALADPLRLRQVLINLLSNAVKYNRPGGTVRVSAHALDDEVLVEVADTGMGMTAEQLRHLYEPFNRLGREHGRADGTGLGLALSRQLVDLMGGRIGIESQPGAGTTARVGLPRAPARDAARAVGQDEGQVSAGREPRGTVLYIEDNEINVMVIEGMLSRWADVRFVHAPDGLTGIREAAALRPDLVLLDMHLPDMDGTEILERLRADPATANLQVVALSADVAAEDMERALAAGAADYWIKPVELQTFLVHVARRLDRAADRVT